MLAQDHYAVLGVTRKASDISVKKAYRRLVLRYHPDRNPGNKQAEEQFKRIASAYELLSSRHKRAEYDSMLDALDRTRQQAYAESARRQQQRRPSQARSETTARKSSSVRDFRRSSRISVPYGSNELDRRDLMNGLVAGAAFSIVFAPLAPISFHPSWLIRLLWSSLPLSGGLLGGRLGERLEKSLSEMLARRGRLDPLPQMVLALTPSFSTVILASTFVIGAHRLGKLPFPIEGLLGSALAAGLAATIGSGLGRAFTSVAVRPSAKFAGTLLGALIGGFSGAILGFFFGASQINRLLDLDLYDILLNCAVSGSMGGALASVIGSCRADVYTSLHK